MAPKSQKLDISSFFKPSAHTIPAKRPSPSHEEREVQYITTKPKQTYLQTPQSGARFKDVTSSPFRSPMGPGSGNSVKIPIRSPMPNPSREPVTSFSSRLSSYYKDSPVEKQKEDVETAGPAAQPFSFADLPSSTQSVIKDGKVVAVKGSDDDDSDSLSSLEDILGRRKSETATSSSSPPELDAGEREAERVRSIFRFTSGRSQPLVGRDKLRELNSKERDHKVNIGALMGDHFDDQEIEGNIRKVQQEYKAAKEEEHSRKQGDVDRDLLAVVLAAASGEGNDMSRLMNAVERTEALNLDRSWSFFGPHGPQTSTARPTEIAIDAQLSDLWRETLQDNDSRSRAFLSGYMREIWSDEHLPDAIIQWTFDSIVQEPQNELRRSYVRAFERVRPAWVRAHLHPSAIERIFLKIGASQQSVQSQDFIEPAISVSRGHEPPDYRYMLSVIEVLVAVAPHLERLAYGKLLSILARLALDAEVMGDARVSVAVEDGLAELIELSLQKDDLAIAGSFVAEFRTYLTDPVLQAQLLKHIPCTSALAAHVRIQLAHQFLLGSGPGPPTDLFSLSIDITTLTEYLDSGTFDTIFRSPNKRPDYTNMTALTYLLDIAIADGGRPSSTDSRAEVEFNRNVDKLANRVKAIFASIADTGASHMRRTEAKEALQALHYRLLFAVRTEPRPKKNVFGGRDGAEHRAEERSKGFMSKFLAKKQDKKSSQGTSQEVPLIDSSLASELEPKHLISRQLMLDA